MSTLIVLHFVALSICALLGIYVALKVSHVKSTHSTTFSFPQLGTYALQCFVKLVAAISQGLDTLLLTAEPITIKTLAAR